MNENEQEINGPGIISQITGNPGEKPLLAGNFTTNDIEDLLSTLKKKSTDKPFVIGTGVGGCENALETMGTTMFLMAIDDGSLQPLGEEAAEFVAKVRSREIPFVRCPELGSMAPSDVPMKLESKEAPPRGNKFTPKKKKRK